MRGLPSTKIESDVYELPNLDMFPMVWLQVDPSWISNETILIPEEPVGALAKEENREEKHMRKLLKDAMEYVNITEGEHAAKTLRQALRALKDGGVVAITSNDTYRHAVESALTLMSEEMEPDTARKYGDVVTMEDWMAVRGQTENPEEGAGCVQGDMCTTDNASKAVLIDRIAAGYTSAINLYDLSKPITTCINPVGASALKTRIWGEALQQIKNLVPCITVQFEEMDYKMGCMLIVGGTGKGICYSNIGQADKVYGSTVALGPGCEVLGIAVHEIGHALGMFHEQSRSDRDEHVTVIWDNIRPSFKSQFKVMGDESTEIPYDITSVMHYAKGAFPASPGLDTLSEFDGSTVEVMGNRMGLADSDVRQLASMYGCTEHLGTVCPSDSCIQHNCVCHQAAGGTPIVKQSRDGCSRCIEQCTDCGGTDCACPIGCQALSRAGRTYCVTEGTTSCLTGEAIDFTDPCEASPAAVTPVAATPASQGGKKKACRDLPSIPEGWCLKHVQYCSNAGVMVKGGQGKQINFQKQACPKTCNACR